MPTSRVKIFVENGEVLVKYNGEIINRLSASEALECSGNIQKAGEFADSHPDRVLDAPVTVAEDITTHGPLNASPIASENSKDQDEYESDRDWKGNNKNNLIHGPM